MIFVLFIVSVGWYIKDIDGNNLYISIGENKFKLSYGVQIPEFGFEIEAQRFSKVSLIRQSIYNPSKYKHLIVDEETKVGIYKEGITLFYGKIYLDFGNIQEKEKEVIYLFGSPFYIKISSGKVIVFSADIGYFLYCGRCEGNIWRGNTAVKNLVPRTIFFINENYIKDEFVDDELFELLKNLEARMREKGKFAKDIFFSHTNEVPKPRQPEKKKFEEKKNFDLEKERHRILVETLCYELIKEGKKCEIKK